MVEDQGLTTSALLRSLKLGGLVGRVAASVLTDRIVAIGRANPEVQKRRADNLVRNAQRVVEMTFCVLPLWQDNHRAPSPRQNLSWPLIRTCPSATGRTDSDSIHRTVHMLSLNVSRWLNRPTTLGAWSYSFRSITSANRSP